MKEIEIMPTDEQIKYMWELDKKLFDEYITYEEYYKIHKVGFKALFG